MLSNFSFKRLLAALLCLLFFLLPWQTRWLYDWQYLNGGFWEYGSGGLYGTEILLWLIVLLFAGWKFGRKEFWREIFSVERYRKNKRVLFWYLAFGILYGAMLWHSVNFNVSLQWTARLLGAWCLGVVILSLSYFRRDPTLVLPPYQVRGKLLKGEETESGILIQSPPFKEGVGGGLVFALWLGGVVQGVIAVIQFFTQTIPANKWLGLAAHGGADGGASVIEFAGGRFLRAYGSFGSPNALGIYLAVILVLGLIIYLKIEDLRLKIVISVGQLVILSGLILSFSRSAWLSAAVGIIFLLIFNLQSSILKNIGKQVVYYLILILIFISILNPLFSARFNLNNRLESRSVSERVSQYQEFQSLVTSYKLQVTSYAFGLGPGNYTLALYEKYPNRQAWQYQPIHNIYPLALTELGIFLSFYLFIVIFWLLTEIWRYNRIYLAVALTLLFAGLFDHWLFSMWTGVVFFWVVLFLGQACFKE